MGTDEWLSKYLSNNGFISNIWGPSFWFIIHSTSFIYPYTPSVRESRLMQDWFEGLADILPCRACRENFAQNLSETNYDPDIVFENRFTFSHFVWRLHNTINMKLNKQTITPSYETVVHTYRHIVPHSVWNIYIHNDGIKNTPLENKPSSSFNCRTIMGIHEYVPTTSVSMFREYHRPRTRSIPPYWDPCWWFMIHIIALNYPISPTRAQRASYGYWLQQHCTLLPEIQPTHVLYSYLGSSFLQKYILQSRYTFVYFVHSLYNAIHDTNIPIGILDQYEHFRAQYCTSPSMNDPGTCYSNKNMRCHMITPVISTSVIFCNID